MDLNAIYKQYGQFEENGKCISIKGNGLVLIHNILHVCDTATVLHPFAQFANPIEYTVVRRDDPSGAQGTCQCGKQGCIYMYKMHNIFTGKCIDRIGSCCGVQRFSESIKIIIRSDIKKRMKAKRMAVKNKMLVYGERQYAGMRLNDYASREKRYKKAIGKEYLTKMQYLCKHPDVSDELKKYFKWSISHSTTASVMRCTEQ
jgi:hypothetical protein